MKCVLNNRIRDKLCVQFKMNPFWTFFLVYFYYYHNSCYFCYEMKFLLFFLIFCYQIKCPGILKIYLPKFLSYTHYYCHISLLKYKGTIWTTLYVWSTIALHGPLQDRFRKIFWLGNCIKNEIYNFLCWIQWILLK